MMSGSTDGLINLYNLETMIEEDALYQVIAMVFIPQVIKTESVAKVGYFGPDYEYLYSLSHMETFSMYKFQEVSR
jgi:hypothetical protein